MCAYYFRGFYRGTSRFFVSAVRVEQLQSLVIMVYLVIVHRITGITGIATILTMQNADERQRMYYNNENIEADKAAAKEDCCCDEGAWMDNCQS